MEALVSSVQSARFTLSSRGQLPASAPMETSVSSLQPSKFTHFSRGQFPASAPMEASVSSLQPSRRGPQSILLSIIILGLK